MQSMREFGNALVIALISLGLVLGALSISLVEFVPEAPPTSTQEFFATPIPLTATATASPTETPAIPIADSPSSTAVLTATAISTAAASVSCSIPGGWQSIIVQAGDTLESIAFRYNTNAATLQSGNCLFSTTLVPGSQLRVPPGAPKTSTVCVPGAAGWSYTYIVQPGDGLYRIALNHYTTLDLLKQVNCRSTDTIYAGEKLWVPIVPATRTAIPTAQPGETITVQPTLPLTETALPFTATYLPTNTAVPATQTPLPTTTPAETATTSAP